MVLTGLKGKFALQKTSGIFLYLDKQINERKIFFIDR